MKKDRKFIRHILLIIAGIAVLLFGDQITKLLAVRYLANQESILLIPGVLKLQYLENRGAAFGVLQNQQWIFMSIAFLFVLFAGYLFFHMPCTKRYLPLHILLMLLVSGAVGNAVDRVFRGFVVDFIYFSLIDFPIFNVADIYVVVSCILGFLFLMFYYKEDDFLFLKKGRGANP